MADIPEQQEKGGERLTFLLQYPQDSSSGEIPMVFRTREVGITTVLRIKALLARIPSLALLPEG